MLRALIVLVVWSWATLVSAELVEVPGGLWLPEPFPSGSSYPSVDNVVLLDASGEKYALIFRAPKTGTLDRFEVRLGAVTQAPASGLKFSFQTVDLTTGHPDEVVDENATVTAGLTAQAWVNPGSFSSGRSVTRGDLVAAVVEFAAWAAGDSLQLSAWYGAGDVAPVHTTYADHKTVGAWAKNTSPPPFALRYTDGSYAVIPGVHPASAVNAIGFTSSSTPDERGMRFTLPFAARLRGVLFRLENAASASVDVVLYQDSTVLETIALDTDTMYSVGAARPAMALFDSLLSANTLYRVVVKPGATSLAIFDFEVAAAAIMDAFGGGQNFHYTQRTDGGAWTDTTTKRPWMNLWLSQVHDGAGAGGAPPAH